MVALWQLVPAPRAYVEASRQRMHGSAIQEWVERAANPAPVEGQSEVDISLVGQTYQVFIEANPRPYERLAKFAQDTRDAEVVTKNSEFIAATNS